jgi:hypothetical protein
LRTEVSSRGRQVLQHAGVVSCVAENRNSTLLKGGLFYEETWIGFSNRSVLHAHPI